MNSQNLGRTKHAVSKLMAVVFVAVVLIAAVVGSIFVLNSSLNNAANSTSTPAPEATNIAASSSPFPETTSATTSSIQVPLTNSTATNFSTLTLGTTDYSVFQPVSGLGNGTWQFEGNNLHVCNYTFSGTIATFNVTVGASVIVPPTLCDGLLLVDLSTSTKASGTTQFYGGVVAIDVQTGQIVWETIVPNMMMAQPLTYDGLVIIGLGGNALQPSYPEVRGTGTNYVAALNFSTGQQVWSFPTDGEDMPTPVIYNGMVVWANGNGVVYALNALTGEEVWNAQLPAGTFVSMSSPALLGDSIYFGGNDPYVFYCVNLTDGQISWSTPVPANGGLDDCSPVIWNGVVISGYTFVNITTGLLEPALIGMNTTNGNILWQIDEKAGPFPPAIQVPPVTVWKGIVYSDPTESDTLYAVNASTGTILWTYNTGGDNSNANIYSGNLWMVNSAGTLLVLNPTSGTLINETNVGGGLGPGNLIFAGQNVIICEQKGQVISIPVSNVLSTG